MILQENSVLKAQQLGREMVKLEKLCKFLQECLDEVCKGSYVYYNYYSVHNYILLKHFQFVHAYLSISIHVIYFKYLYSTANLYLYIYIYIILYIYNLYIRNS